jgi:transposase-like protein
MIDMLPRLRIQERLVGCFRRGNPSILSVRTNPEVFRLATARKALSANERLRTILTSHTAAFDRTVMQLEWNETFDHAE